jgi:hypothetical protein
MLTIDAVFTTRLEVEKYLANVYSYLPDPADPYANFTPVSDEGDFVDNHWRQLY